MTTTGRAGGTRRDESLRSIAARVDRATATGDGGPVHEPAAWREGEELMSCLATADGVDEEALYVLGMLFLARTAVARPAAWDAEPVTASTQAAAAVAAGSPSARTLAWILLAPFYFHQPESKDILDPGAREFLRQLHGGPQRLSTAARRQGHAEAVANLGFFLLTYRVSTGNVAVARSATGVLRLAAGGVAEDHPHRPVILCNLGYALLLGNPGPEETREAVGVLRESFRLTPAAHPNYARCANGLGLALLGDGELTQDRGKLREACDLLSIAARGAAKQEGQDMHLAQILASLGLALATWVRTADSGQAADGAVRTAAEEAVAALGRAVDLTPEGDPNRAVRLARLADAEQIRLRLKRLTDTSRIDELLAAVERLLAEPEPAPGSLLRIGLELASRQLTLIRIRMVTGVADQQAALEAVLRIGRSVQDSLPQMMKALASAGTSVEALAAFGQSWVSPFDMLALIDESLPGYRRALAGASSDAPEYAQAKTSLALMLFFRSGLAFDEGNYAEAIGLARELVASAWPPSPVLLSTWAQREVSRAQFSFLDWKNVGPDIATEGDQGRSGSPLTRLATGRAAEALARQNPAAALETLEDGRAHLLSSALNVRRELETLRGADAELYARLVAIDEEFLTWQRSNLGHRMGATPSPEEMEWFRTRSAEGANLTAELRRRPGFDRFLMPRRLSLADLQPAADGGPVVSVNIDPRRCDALALATDGLHVIPLPKLSAADLAEQASAFGTAVEVLAGRSGDLASAAGVVFAGVLGWLWDVLAEPVLEALGHGAPPGHDETWPRVWWSPTGLLNMFPLHAAGYHDRPGCSVLDRVASSYTPTLRALLASRARAVRSSRDRRVLTIAMPRTPGHAPLAETIGEAIAAAGQGGLRLIGADATREAVLAALPGAALVHFACHARSDPDEPTGSRLLLHDGDLRLTDLTRLHLAGAELAYLSACGTTRGGSALAGEAVHLASAFQLAGFCQSVATGWEIADGFAATAAARFHQILAPALAEPDPLPAALALHQTVRELKEMLPDQPWTWSALLHAGA